MAKLKGRDMLSQMFSLSHSTAVESDVEETIKREGHIRISICKSCAPQEIYAFIFIT